MVALFAGISDGEARLRCQGNDWRRYCVEIKNPDPVDKSAAY